jgi:hypothetical protein
MINNLFKFKIMSYDVIEIIILKLSLLFIKNTCRLIFPNVSFEKYLSYTRTFKLQTIAFETIRNKYSSVPTFYLKFYEFLNY